MTMASNDLSSRDESGQPLVSWHSLGLFYSELSVDLSSQSCKTAVICQRRQDVPPYSSLCK